MNGNITTVSPPDHPIIPQQDQTLTPAENSACSGSSVQQPNQFHQYQMKHQQDVKKVYEDQGAFVDNLQKAREKYRLTPLGNNYNNNGSPNITQMQPKIVERKSSDQNSVSNERPDELEVEDEDHRQPQQNLEKQNPTLDLNDHSSSGTRNVIYYNNSDQQYINLNDDDDQLMIMPTPREESQQSSLSIQPTLPLQPVGSNSNLGAVETQELTATSPELQPLLTSFQELRKRLDPELENSYTTRIHEIKNKTTEIIKQLPPNQPFPEKITLYEKLTHVLKKLLSWPFSWCWKFAPTHFEIKTQQAKKYQQYCILQNSYHEEIHQGFDRLIQIVNKIRVEIEKYNQPDFKCMVRECQSISIEYQNYQYLTQLIDYLITHQDSVPQLSMREMTQLNNVTNLEDHYLSMTNIQKELISELKQSLLCIRQSCRKIAQQSKASELQNQLLYSWDKCLLGYLNHLYESLLEPNVHF